MTPQIVLVHVLLAGLLFFLANWLGSHSISSGYHLITLFERVDEAPAFNFVFRVLTPLIYLVLVAALAYRVGLDEWTTGLYLVVVYYFVLRWSFNAIIGRGRLLNWPLQLLIASVTVLAAYQLHGTLLSKPENLLPDAAGLTNELWLLVIAYLYNVLNRVPFTHAGAARRRAAYIRHRYRLLSQQFSRQVTPLARNGAEEALVYAVMIYETFNRPWIYRLIERRILFPAGLGTSLGPMQVQIANVEKVDDATGVEVGAQKLLLAYRAALPAAERQVSDWSGVEGRSWHAKVLAVRQAAHQYNIRGAYGDEVQSIFESLVQDFYPWAGRAAVTGNAE